ncbi:MAG: zinc-ribbon domain-containing protein, partial [Oscillospiraceae bacterium]|nr:zinc-ribbon domain-containing protein [Oscillospiraceae bacterium]
GFTKCANCGADVANGAAFCANCGAPNPEAQAAAPAARFCGNCGTPAEPGSAFCNNCGSKL